MVLGDLNLFSHSYMHFMENMCRVTALLEIEKNSVNIETRTTNDLKLFEKGEFFKYSREVIN